ncbi:MAG TPA: lysophospholipid acyltransferase family protein, partial [Spirochaetia bacterium]|nr:lysophospholipid acyltransferase family protein [Spirochaetia bacterium]
MAKRTQRRDRRRLRAYKFLNIVLRKSLGLYVCSSYRVRTKNFAVVRSLSSPYLILPNHMSFWDPFFLGALVPEPIYYVTSDANFRSRMLNYLLGLVGAIPKTKVLSDYETIRNILRVKRNGGIIGVYPEGRRTWDGTTLPLYY